MKILFVGILVIANIVMVFRYELGLSREWSFILVLDAIIILLLIFLQRRNFKLENTLLSLKKEKQKLTFWYESEHREVKILNDLSNVSRTFLEKGDLNIVFDQILDSARKILNVDISIIELSHDASHHNQPVTRVFKGVTDIVFDKIVYDKVISAGSSILINNLSADHTDYKRYQLLTNQGIKSILVAPLKTKGKVIGLLGVLTKTERDFTSTELDTLSNFATHSSLIIENGRLLNIERNFTKELNYQVEIAKKKLKEAQERLIKSERLAAIGESTSFVAHEIKNPMATISGSAELINEELPEGHPSKKYVGFISTELKRLDKMVKDILSFSREPKLTLGEENINNLIIETLSFLDNEIQKKQITVIKELAPAPLFVTVDKDSMKQVFLNIIQNAMHVLINREKREIRFNTKQEDKNLCISIADTGPGIPIEAQKKIFEPFYTAGKKAGTGLGLAICRRLVESHGGKIKVESPCGEGKGTMFLISLPLSSDYRSP